MKFFYLVLFFIFLNSCSNSENAKKKSLNPTGHNMPPFISSIIDKYTLPYDKKMGADSNNLIFYYCGLFDTTVLVHFQNNDTSINVVLYQILPNYHKEDDDYADKESELLFFEGYSFKIAVSKWSEIISLAKNKLLISKNQPPKHDPCFDCAFFFLNYDSVTLINNSNTHAAFREYFKFLKDSVLDDFIKLRQPKFGNKNK